MKRRVVRNFIAARIGGVVSLPFRGGDSLGPRSDFVLVAMECRDYHAMLDRWGWACIGWGGAGYGAMQQVVNTASQCETGLLSISGRPKAKSEAFIREARQAVESALAPDAFAQMDFQVRVDVADVTPKDALAEYEAKFRQDITAFRPPQEMHGGGRRWRLSPFDVPEDAALAILLARARWTHFDWLIEGPSISRLPTRAAA